MLHVQYLQWLVNPHRSSDSESGHLLEGNQLNSATPKRESYGGTPSASHVSPTSKYKSSVRTNPPPRHPITGTAHTHSTELPKTTEVSDRECRGVCVVVNWCTNVVSVVYIVWLLIASTLLFIYGQPPSKHKFSVRYHHPPAHTLGPSSTPSPVTVPRSSSKTTGGRDKMTENAEVCVMIVNGYFVLALEILCDILLLYT